MYRRMPPDSTSIVSYGNTVEIQWRHFLEKIRHAGQTFKRNGIIPNVISELQIPPFYHSLNNNECSVAAALSSPPEKPYLKLLGQSLNIKRLIWRPNLNFRRVCLPFEISDRALLIYILGYRTSLLPKKFQFTIPIIALLSAIIVACGRAYF